MPDTFNSWTALVAEDADLRKRLDTMRARFPMLTAGGMFPRAAAYSGAAVTFSQAITMLGVRAAEPYFAPYLGILDAAIGETAFEQRRTVTMGGLLWFVHLARCAGQPVSQGAIDAVAAWVPQLAERLDWLDTNGRHSLAYIALGYGFDSLVARFIEGIEDPFPAPAASGHATAAWPALLRRFPFFVSLGAAQWPFLFLAASRSLNVELPQVALETHKQVMQQIAQGA